jgi:D-alanyl-D-alanine carboxypeptidase
MGKRSLGWTLGVLLLVLSCGPGPDRSEPRLEQRLQGVLDRGVEKHGVRGVTAAVVFPDGRLWTAASGVSHDTVPMAPEMLFGIGSVTKNFVAALVLQLVEEGALTLDDTVADHLPPFSHVDGRITIRQLLDHTSGLYMFWDNDDLWDALKADRARVWTPDEVLAYIREPYFEPGEGWRYSNTNYLLAGMIVEKVTGSTLSAELRRRFFEPLGLEGYLSIQEEIPDRMAHVFGDNFQYGAAEKDLTYEPRAAHESIIFGSGGLFMTASDLARWGDALFHRGGALAEDSIAEMYRFVEFRPVANMRAYGLGVHEFRRRFAFGERVIGHGGGNIGSATYLAYLPEHGLTVVAMVNAFPTSSIDDFTRDLIEVVLRDRGTLGWIPYIPLFPEGVFIVCVLTSLTALTVSIVARWRRRRGD